MAKVKEKVLKVKLNKNHEAAVSTAHQIFNTARQAQGLDYISEDNFALEMVLQASLYLIKQYKQALEEEEANRNSVLNTDGTVTPAEVADEVGV